MAANRGSYELPQPRLSRWRWPIVLLLTLAILLYETVEHKPAVFPDEREEYLREIFLFGLVLPAFMGIVLELLTRYYRERYHHIAYLNLDQMLRSQLAAARNPEEIEHIVLRLPSEVLPLSGSSLHILETPLYPQRHTSHRGFNGKPLPGRFPDPAWETCLRNPARADPSQSSLAPCACTENLGNPGPPYCLPLEYGGAILAILVLYLQPGYHPTGEQTKLLTEIAPSLAQAVDRAILFRAVSRQALATREERHRIARDLHDSLAQNLAFLRLNLEHLVAKFGSETSNTLFRDELNQMSQVADESYEYLREAIEQLDPVVQPHLESVLRNHAQTIGKRAGFSVVMETSGETRKLSPGIQRQILFIFRELVTVLSGPFPPTPSNYKMWGKHFTVAGGDQTVTVELGPIRRPVRDLTRAAQQIDRGELETTLNISESGEIGAMAAALEHMRQKLTASLEQLADLNENLETRVKEQTAHLRQQQALTRQLLRRAITAQEDERARLSRELHDEIGQVLTALEIGIERLIHVLPTDELEALEQLQKMRALTDQAIIDLRRMITALRPGVLDELGLIAALDWISAHMLSPLGVNVRLQVEGMDGRLPNEIETVLFRIAQEAMSNVVRHSQAKNLVIRLEKGSDQVTMTLSDDGQGLDLTRTTPASDSTRGLGLAGMRERASLVRGQVSIESSAGKGTTVQVIIPLPDAAAQDRKE